MGVIDTGDKKSFDVHLNIVPFIDLMSCLTAFLLVTAVWSNNAQLQTKPQGLGRHDDGTRTQPTISILVEADRIYVGVTELAIDPVVALAPDGTYDWTTVAAALAALRDEEVFDGRRDVQIAVDSTDARAVPYRDLIAAMDVAAAAGFDDVKVTAPSGLAWRPSR